MAKPWTQHPLSRVVSLALAASLSAVILVYPHALIQPDGSAHHGWLMLLLAGISIGFIHGVGFSPRTWFWRQLFGPLLGWGIMVPGIVYLLLN